MRHFRNFEPRQAPRFTLVCDGQERSIGRLARDALVAAGLVYRDDDDGRTYHTLPKVGLSDLNAAVLA